MRVLIQNLICKLYVWTYFRHVYAENLPRDIRENLLILSHRNGAIDGFVYHSVLKKGVFLLARQLQKNAFLRFLFPGIAVSRAKDMADKERSNTSALRACLSVLREGKEPLCLFPEGTSSLGPTHLPFHNGYAKMAEMNTAAGSRTNILPVAIVYDDPTKLGGSVWVIGGQKISVSADMTADDIGQQTLSEFEKITFSYSSGEAQQLAHQAAVLAVLSKKMSYVTALKRIREKADILDIVRQYHQNIPAGMLSYKGVKIYPQSVLQSVWVVGITIPIVVPTLLFNLIPILMGYLAGRTRLHDPNTISLWRGLVGYPAGALMYVVGLFCSPLWMGGAFLFSLWGLHLYGAFKKHMYALINWMLYHRGYSLFQESQHEIIQKLCL